MKMESALIVVMLSGALCLAAEEAPPAESVSVVLKTGELGVNWGQTPPIMAVLGPV